MTEPKAGYFCAYTSSAVHDNDAVVEALNRGQFDNPPSETQWSVPQVPFSSPKPSAFIAHHRQSPSVLEKQYFVIADRSDWKTSSVLAINLDFEGYEDATRMQVGVAGDALPSVSVANTEWAENLGATPETWPKERFAVYVTAQGEIDREALVQKLDAGLGGRKSWTMGGGVCRDATALLPGDRGIDLAAVAELHQSIAEREKFDPAMFIVVENADWESAGVSVVRIEAEGIDVCNKPAEYAAEVLTWIDQGLYSWPEGKEWSK